MTSPARRLRFFCRDEDVSALQVASSLQVRSYRNSYVEAAQAEQRGRPLQKKSPQKHRERLVNQLRSAGR
jgi:hypothetical protein